MLLFLIRIISDRIDQIQEWFWVVSKIIVAQVLKVGYPLKWSFSLRQVFKSSIFTNE